MAPLSAPANPRATRWLAALWRAFFVTDPSSSRSRTTSPWLCGRQRATVCISEASNALLPSVPKNAGAGGRWLGAITRSARCVPPSGTTGASCWIAALSPAVCQSMSLACLIRVDRPRSGNRSANPCTRGRARQAPSRPWPRRPAGATLFAAVLVSSSTLAPPSASAALTAAARAEMDRSVPAASTNDAVLASSWRRRRPFPSGPVAWKAMPSPCLTHEAGANSPSGGRFGHLKAVAERGAKPA